MYASVVVVTDAPGLPQPFTYRVPEELQSSVFQGACVAVPFGGRELVGYVLDLTDELPGFVEAKDLRAVIPEACALRPSLVRLAWWISKYYAASLPQTIRAIVPEVLSATVSAGVRLLDPAKVSASSPAQRKIVEVLAEMGGEADAGSLKARVKSDKFTPALRQLTKRAAVEVVRILELPKAKPRLVRGLQRSPAAPAKPDKFARKAPKQAAILKELQGSESPVRQSELLRRTSSSSSPAKALVDKGLAEKVDLQVQRRPLPPTTAEDSGFTLTQAQEQALDIIRESLVVKPKVTLLYGVTGSGKTEIYLRAIADVLADGRSCIALVPEISLTTHLMGAYASRFGDQLAILHSKLSVGERHDEWRRVESDEARVVLGPRSAVFAPVQDLGLIVVDEEHEPSYKQEHAPRYNARAVAEERAASEGASVILGSATPAVETFYRAKSGEIRLAVLEKRIEDRPLPTVQTVDLREEFAQGRRSVFSEQLQEAIADRLKRREQVILFVNRRGYASFILCRHCGFTANCPNCAVSMTYHAVPRVLRCHHCNSSSAAPTTCPNCGGVNIRQFGIGTQRVEEEVRRMFPEASTIRMDSDTTTGKHSYARLLRTFSAGEADILVGTQMVAKGLDFPNVTLVGVVSADTSLHLPDFRAAERTFQILTQVSGRAGRGNVPGEVIVQSFSPEHYAVQAAARQDFPGFYEQEVEYREELSYPPFARLVNIVSSDPMEDYAEARLREFAGALEGNLPESIDLAGPAPAPISKLKGLYRWHLLLKDRSPEPGAVQEILAKALESVPSAVGMALTIDVDPLSML